MQIILGDSLSVLKILPDQSAQTCVTSPPYWGLRDYGVTGQLGLEKTPQQFVAAMVELFHEVRRVLRNDGTLWVNLGDCYAQSKYGSGGGWAKNQTGYDNAPAQDRSLFKDPGYKHGLKNKDLVGIPWRVAFGLQAAGWYLRQDIIWHKPNPMPESVTDRCTKAHEYIFLLSKSASYYFDHEALKEPTVCSDPREVKSGLVRSRMYGYSTKENELRTGKRKNDNVPSIYAGGGTNVKGHSGNSMNTPDGKRNKRSVWTVTTKPYQGAHFATFPPDLIEPCILAGAPEGGIVLDPFLGSGTTAAVAKKLGRDCIGIELNPAYLELAEQRLAAVLPPQVPLIAA
jgi:DNA modification methylase